MSTEYILRQCITLRNGKRLCKPPGQAFRIPINDNAKPPNNDADGSGGEKAS